jgi:hypothetical protein
MRREQQHKPMTDEPSAFFLNALVREECWMDDSGDCTEAVLSSNFGLRHCWQ